MSTPATELRRALEDFQRVATSRESATIARALDRILECEAQLGPDADPQLRHYLQRRSYQKALEWLAGAEPEPGGCGR